jgi:ubiquinone/menaquinone biosynthesis C-methylase UbiE
VSADDTDVQWEKWGRLDPYYGVLSEDRFLNRNLSADDKTAFFRSGHEYVQHVLTQIKRIFDPDFAPKRAIDFGCGVGRIVIPLSEVAENVVGIDVSKSMIDEARKNCEERAIQNAKFVLSDDAMSTLTGSFDFIHSFIVFQHIPVERGEEILDSLLSHLEAGGVCAVHFPYSQPEAPPSRRAAQWMKKYIPFAYGVINTLRGRNVGTPEMQMNAYDLSRLSLLMENHGACRYFAEYTKHGAGIRGVLLYFQKETDPERSRPAVLDVARP